MLYELKEFFKRCMLFFLFFIPFFSYAFIYHDFDDAMQISRYPNTDYAKRTFKEVGVSADDILDFLGIYITIIVLESFFNVLILNPFMFLAEILTSKIRGV